MKLAGIRLAAKDAAVHDEAVAVLKELSRKPGKGLDALRALIADATNYREWSTAREYADALVASPGAVFQDKITRLAIHREMKSQDASGYLMELRNAGLQNPPDLYLLLMWMNQHGLGLMVAEWAQTLPEEIIGRPPVCVAVADAYVRSSDWKTLLAFLEGHSWAEWEYMRRAFLARATERLGDAARSAQEWSDSVAAARSRGDSRDRLERLTRLVIGWGWEQRAQEVMWGLANAPGCPRWMLDALWLIAIENTDTAQLQKLAGLLAKADPKSVIFRNNYAFYSLLTHAEEGDPHREAERLFAENPQNVDIVLTRGLSLYQRGRAGDAAALTGGLSADELKKPHVALYHAIFLIATGENAKAAEFMEAAGAWKMLAEEKALMERAKLEVWKLAQDSKVAEESKAIRAARAAKDAAEEKEFSERIRAMRAAKTAKDAAEERDFAERSKAARAARAVIDLEKEKAVEEARSIRAIKAAHEAAEAPAKKAAQSHVDAK